MAPSKSVEDEQKLMEEEYKKHFSPNAYCDEYCQESNVYMRSTLISLHRVFAIEVTNGDSILDFGSGPNIYATISASKRFNNIVTSDFVDSNRNSLHKWLRGDRDANDFTGLFKLAAALENETDYRKLEARVRQNVKEVIPCNAHLSNPIAPDTRKFDVVTTSYALESANATFDSYRKSIVNVASLLKPGGKFVQVVVLEGSFYNVGGHQFPGCYLTKEMVRQSVTEAGLKPVLWSFMPLEVPEEDSDCKEICLVVCIKTGV